MLESLCGPMGFTTSIARFTLIRAEKNVPLKVGRRLAWSHDVILGWGALIKI
jgi:hypothetical protein